MEMHMIVKNSEVAKCYVAISDCPKCGGAVFDDYMLSKKCKDSIAKCFMCGEIYLKQSGKLILFRNHGA